MAEDAAIISNVKDYKNLSSVSMCAITAVFGYSFYCFTSQVFLNSLILSDCLYVKLSAILRTHEHLDVIVKIKHSI